MHQRDRVGDLEPVGDRVQAGGRDEQRGDDDLQVAHGAGFLPTVGLAGGSLRKARGPDRARARAVQRRDRFGRAGRGPADRHRRVLRARARRGAGHRPGGVAPARARGGRAGARAVAGDVARGVPRAHRDGDAAMCRQPPRGPDRHPRHPGRGAVGPGRHRHRDVDRRGAGRRARARPSAARGRTRRLRGHRPLTRRQSRRSPSAARSRSTRRAAPRSCSPGR